MPTTNYALDPSRINGAQPETPWKIPTAQRPPPLAEVGSQRCVAPKATEEREADKEGTQQREDGDGEGKGKAGEGGGGVTLDIHLELDSDNNNNNNNSKSID